jgi:3-dehydrotetronate 4-kinase
MGVPVLGCIADDYTGATDLASNLAESGMRVVQVFMKNDGTFPRIDPEESDAIVVALKTRSIDPPSAIAQSIAACRYLQGLGTQRFYFKYCSTFDSTDQGNIGNVAEALMVELKVEQTIFSPAFPDNHRKVFCGHLFVNGKLLHESGMEKHPLNPMTDAHLQRVLSRQATMQVGGLDHATVALGSEEIYKGLNGRLSGGERLMVVDAISNRDLCEIARACADMRLITGSSGVAIGLPDAYRRNGLLGLSSTGARTIRYRGRSAIITGSCSSATQRQVAAIGKKYPVCRLEPQRCVSDRDSYLDELIRYSMMTPCTEPIVIASTSDAETVATDQAQFGREALASAIEATFGLLVRRLVDEVGVEQLIVAGGETSGAVINALEIDGLRIGPRIAPGVPWTETIGQRKLAVVLKSGNFGEDRFFEQAMEMVPR